MRDDLCTSHVLIPPMLLLMLFSHPAWRCTPQSKAADEIEKKIINLFGDRLDDECPFSIHNLLALGEQKGQVPGQWFGPAQVSYLMR